MPTFRTSPTSGLAASIRDLIAGAGPVIGPLQEMQADQMAAETAQKLGLAEKARREAEAMGLRTRALQDQTGFVSAQSGAPARVVQRMQDYLQNGNWGSEQPGAAEIQDMNLVGREAQPREITEMPAEVTPFAQAVRRGLQTYSAMLAGKESTADQIAKASGEYQGQSITDAVRAAIDRGDTERASALNQGGKLGTQIKVFDNIGDTGAVFSPASGVVRADPTAQPDNKLLAGTLAGQEARRALDAERANTEKTQQGAQRASAAASFAHAGLFNAQAANERSQGNLGKPPAGYRWGDADAQGAPTLVPIAGGPAEKLGEGQVKQLVGVQTTRDAIGEYRDALKKWSIFDMANPNARAQMGTVYNNMLLQAKEAYNLGVLNGPDYDILQTVISDPTSLRAGFISNKALDGQAKKLDEILGRIGITVANASKQRQPAGQAPRAALASTNARGWKLMRDAAGNQAYVSPDGKSFEEAR